MDLQRLKQISEGKIKAGILTKELRGTLKEYKHNKQDLQQGLSETFKPIIKAQEETKQTIDAKQDKLIEQLQKNQKAITSGLENIEMLSIQPGQPQPQPQKETKLSINYKPAMMSSNQKKADLDTGFDDYEIETLMKYELLPPSSVLQRSQDGSIDFNVYNNKVRKIIKEMGRQKGVLSRGKGKISNSDKIDMLDRQIETIKKYRKRISVIPEGLKTISGKGFEFSSSELQRLEDLNLLSPSNLATAISNREVTKSNYIMRVESLFNEIIKAYEKNRNFDVANDAALVKKYLNFVKSLRMGEGINSSMNRMQPKRNAYKINKSGQYGGLLIDIPKLMGQLRLIASKDGQKVLDKKVDFDTIDLLTKRFNSKKKYSDIAKMVFNELNQLSEIPIHKTSNKFKKIGSGVVYFNNINDLLDRMELLGGSILAGNNGVKNEFSQIAHKLNQLGTISNKQLIELLKNYVM